MQFVFFSTSVHVDGKRHDSHNYKFYSCSAWYRNPSCFIINLACIPMNTLSLIDHHVPTK